MLKTSLLSLEKGETDPSRVSATKKLIRSQLSLAKEIAMMDKDKTSANAVKEAEKLIADVCGGLLRAGLVSDNEIKSGEFNRKHVGKITAGALEANTISAAEVIDAIVANAKAGKTDNTYRGLERMLALQQAVAEYKALNESDTIKKANLINASKSLASLAKEVNSAAHAVASSPSDKNATLELDALARSAKRALAVVCPIEESSQSAVMSVKESSAAAIAAAEKGDIDEALKRAREMSKILNDQSSRAKLISSVSAHQPDRAYAGEQTEKTALASSTLATGAATLENNPSPTNVSKLKQTCNSQEIQSACQDVIPPLKTLSHSLAEIDKELQRHPSNATQANALFNKIGKNLPSLCEALQKNGEQSINAQPCDQCEKDLQKAQLHAAIREVEKLATITIDAKLPLESQLKQREDELRSAIGDALFVSSVSPLVNESIARTTAHLCGLLQRKDGCKLQQRDDAEKLAELSETQSNIGKFAAFNLDEKDKAAVLKSASALSELPQQLISELSKGASTAASSSSSSSSSTSAAVDGIARQIAGHSHVVARLTTARNDLPYIVSQCLSDAGGVIAEINEHPQDLSQNKETILSCAMHLSDRLLLLSEAIENPKQAETIKHIQHQVQQQFEELYSQMEKNPSSPEARNASEKMVEVSKASIALVSSLLPNGVNEAALEVVSSALTSLDEAGKAVNAGDKAKEKKARKEANASITALKEMQNELIKTSPAEEQAKKIKDAISSVEKEMGNFTHAGYSFEENPSSSGIIIISIPFIY